mgnify:CR=1 FL=1|tara:strand:- start:16468 stop:16866 length:399 start_codon:yes stop_codon:yes gene_type:complete
MSENPINYPRTYAIRYEHDFVAFKNIVKSDIKLMNCIFSEYKFDKFISDIRFRKNDVYLLHHMTTGSFSFSYKLSDFIDWDNTSTLLTNDLASASYVYGMDSYEQRKELPGINTNQFNITLENKQNKLLLLL